TRIKRSIGLRAAIAVISAAGIGATALAGPASADPTTVSVTLGPVAIPAVQVNVCTTSMGTMTCTPTPPATTVALTVSATVDPTALTIPTIVPVPCSNGQGEALAVDTGSLGTLISASITITVNGNPTVIPLTLPGPANQIIVIGGCAAPGVPLPGL